MVDTALLRALHALRLSGFADVDVVAARTGLTRSDASAQLVRAADEGWTVFRHGRMPGWLLTADGRREGMALLANELQRAGVAAEVSDLYSAFREINPRFLHVCTDWQVRRTDGELTRNDHSDAGYDSSVIVRLCGIHDDVAPIVDSLAAALARFGSYTTRLGSAVDRVRSGEIDFFTRPMIDSYHTVWFELHEDLLATLGLERGAECR